MAIQLSGSLAITGSLVATSQIVAQTLNVQQVTSSIVYSSGSNIFGNSVSNTQQFTGSLQVSSSTSYILGNVGIGTTSPTNKLDVNGVLSTSGIIPYGTTYKTSNFLDFYPTNDNVLFFHAGTSWGDPLIAVNGTTAGSVLTNSLAQQLVIRGDGTGGIGFSNGSSINMIISGGNVGIGTTNPGRSVHILGATGIGTVLKLEGAAGTTTYLQLSYNGATNVQSGYIGYDSSANMPFFTNDTERMRITSGGNVGIGATNPIHKLEVAGNISINGGSFLDFANGDVRFVNSSGLLSIQTYSISTGLSTKMVVTGVGNVGIGTTSPSARLSLGSATNGERITWSNTSNIFSEYSSGDLWLSSNFYGNLGTSGYVTSVTENFGAAGINVSATGGGLNGVIKFFVDNAASKTAGASFTPTERMRITGGGNVGIGTTSPNVRLQIDVDTTSNAVESLRLRATSANNGTFIGFHQDNTGEIARISASRNGANGRLTLGVSDNAGNVSDTNIFLDGGTTANSGYINFAVGGGSTRMTILENGNVGIGTTSPSQLLHVVGKIYSVASGTDGGEIRLANSGGGSTWYWAARTTGLNLGELASADGRIFIANGGNIGIGTTNPGSYKLNVNGESLFQNHVTIGSDKFIYTNNIGANTNFANLSFSGPSNAHIVFTGANVGIGTTSPSYRLHVVGTEVAFDTSGAMRFYVNRTGANVGSIIFTTGGPGTSNGWGEIGQTDGNGDIFFKANPSAGGFTTRMIMRGATGHIVPGANGTQNLGSDTERWATVFTSDLSLSNGIGDYTIVEGENDLFLYNNKQNKVYKFVIEEVDPSIATPKKS